jgi:hypothetical protein
MRLHFPARNFQSSTQGSKRRSAKMAGGGELGRAVGLHDAMYVLPLMSVALAIVLWVSDRSARAYE